MNHPVVNQIVTWFVNLNTQILNYTILHAPLLCPQTGSIDHCLTPQAMATRSVIGRQLSRAVGSRRRQCCRCAYRQSYKFHGFVWLIQHVFSSLIRLEYMQARKHNILLIILFYCLHIKLN